MHSFTSIVVHCVWTTKNRDAILNPELRHRLCRYIGGIARENKMKALAIGGTADHIHTLISLPATLSIAKAVQLLKGNPRSGFTTHFQSCTCFNGRKDTALSA